MLLMELFNYCVQIYSALQIVCVSVQGLTQTPVVCVVCVFFYSRTSSLWFGFLPVRLVKQTNLLQRHRKTFTLALVCCRVVISLSCCQSAQWCVCVVFSTWSKLWVLIFSSGVPDIYLQYKLSAAQSEVGGGGGCMLSEVRFFIEKKSGS